VRRITPVCSAVLFLAAPLAGCSRDNEIPILHENAAPNSQTIDETTTDAERQKKLLDEMQKQQDKNFDASAGGQAPAAKPAQ
jgi:hypothetical protein